MTLALNEATLIAIDKGISIFNAFKFGVSDKDHVDYLKRHANFRVGGKILDMGCGIGGVADLWGEEDIILINNNELQLSKCPERFDRLLCSFENVPLDDGCADAVMFNFSIGHGNQSLALSEARRLLCDGGILFIYDMVGNGERLVQLNYEIYSGGEVSGMTFDCLTLPKRNFEDRIDNVRYFFNGVVPAFWRYVC
jgi:ubiquinone/menaquinone biosynthesis C-methylase UbiE